MKLSTTLYTLSALLCLAPVAWSQPAVNDGARAQNPPNRPVGGNRRDPTARLQAELTRMKITDPTQQTAVTAFVTSEMQGRMKLQEPSRKLTQALTSDTTDDAQFLGMLNDYQAALDADKSRHDKALEDLRKAVDFTKVPRLEAYLLLSGSVGGGPDMLNMMGRGGRQNQGNRRGQNGAAAGNGQQGGFNRRNAPAAPAAVPAPPAAQAF